MTHIIYKKRPSNLDSRLTAQRPSPRRRSGDPKKTATTATIVAIGLILATVAVYIAVAGKLAPPSCQPLTTNHSVPSGCQR